MTDFQVGNRVCVLPSPETGSYAGRTGTITWVSRNAGGVVSAYHVRLDDDPGAHATIVYVAFRPGELEPEAGGIPKPQDGAGEEE